MAKTYISAETCSFKVGIFMNRTEIFVKKEKLRLLKKLLHLAALSATL